MEIDAKKNDNEGSLALLLSSEVRDCLKACRMIFPQVRLVDHDCNTAYTVDELGNLSQSKGLCFEFWGRVEPCPNCICNKALEVPNTVQKIEPRDNKFYLIIAKRFENAGRHCVIEMLDTIDEEELEKVRTDTSLLDAIRSANAALYSELYRDVQLGIYNRRFFEERFDSLENVTAIAMIDIDGFKEVNDTMGHYAGDVILRAVVEATKKSIRETDFFIRLGGDEGLIAFVGMKRESFASCLEKIRQAVNDLVVPEFPTIKLAVSIGGYFSESITRDGVLIADAEMYRAKRIGNSISVEYDD